MAKETLLRDLHVKFIQTLDQKQDELEYWLSEHLRLSGIYWATTCLHLLNAPDALSRDDIIEYVRKCQTPNGGFGGHINHDAHLLYTYSAIQVLCLYDALDCGIDIEAVVQYVCGLQRPSGAFCGDEWGEEDTRFSYCALACLSLLKRLPHQHTTSHQQQTSTCNNVSVDVDKAVEYIQKCMNFDGGFGSVPGSESHAGQVFCCVAALNIVGRLDIVDRDLLGWWLCERQLPCGGLNGRPEKLEDVCYSWWVLSSLSIIGKLSWIDGDKLVEFILQCQDEETGGISDRPGDVTDVFHTLFGVSGLSLLGYDGLMRVDATYCLPAQVIKRILHHYTSSETR